MSHDKYRVIPTKTFQKNYKALRKKYPSLSKQLDDFIPVMEQGKVTGFDVPGLKLNGNKVFKTDMENIDSRKSKRKGYRIIWYLVTSDDKVYLLSIYSKSDQTNIRDVDIHHLIRQNNLL